MANVLNRIQSAPAIVASYLLLRHATTESNAKARWHGEADESVSSAGRRDTDAAAGRLLRLEARPTLVVSSTLKRARQTAEIIARPIRGVPILEDDGLRERDMGAWKGLAPSELEARWPGMLRRWAAGEIGGPPGGETDAQVAARARRALKKYCDQGASSILVITHGGIIRSLRKVAGLENCAVPHLGGYWFHLTESEEWKVGEQVVLGDPSVEPLT